MIRSYNSDAYVAVFTTAAPTAFDHNGYNSACNSGDVVLFDATRPYVIAHGPSRHVLSVVIPRRLLHGMLAGTSAASGIKLDGDSAAAGILRQFMWSLWHCAETIEEPTAHRMSSIAVDLIAAGFAEKLALDGHVRGRQGAQIVQARAFIEHNLVDPQLNLASVAAAINISPRRLFEIFAHEEKSVADYIWESRLLRAHKLLTSDPKGHAKIASIAYRVGFASPAHFARRFKARFGYTPSDLRQSSLERLSSGLHM